MQNGDLPAHPFSLRWGISGNNPLAADSNFSSTPLWSRPIAMTLDDQLFDTFARCRVLMRQSRRPRGLAG
jgi:hypothetical protein